MPGANRSAGQRGPAVRDKKQYTSILVDTARIHTDCLYRFGDGALDGGPVLPRSRVFWTEQMYLIVAIPLSLLALALSAVPLQKKYSLVPSLFFLIGPVLTYFGVIAILTGFNGSSWGEGYTFGITFYTAYIACQISKHKELLKKNPLNFIFSAVNPLYLFTGPIPTNPLINTKSIKPKRIIKIFYAVNSDVMIGVFFCAILAPSLTPYFYLRHSTNVIDIFVFGLLFEFFVYFNFAGYSMIAWALMRMLGIKAPRNFRQPFGATSIIDYWQRWHRSLGAVLKELFYTRVRPLLGMHGAVFIVFTASALWHGVTINFIVWGSLNCTLWWGAYYFNKLNLKILNYILLVLGIAIGRVIFSESDSAVLFSKLSMLIDFTKWSSDSEYAFLYLGVRETLNLLFVFLVIGWEVVAPRFGLSNRDYKHLRSPVVSTLITVYVCLAFIGWNGEPIYGNR